MQLGGSLTCQMGVQVRLQFSDRYKTIEMLQQIESQLQSGMVRPCAANTALDLFLKLPIEKEKISDYLYFHCM